MWTRCDTKVQVLNHWALLPSKRSEDKVHVNVIRNRWWVEASLISPNFHLIWQSQGKESSLCLAFSIGHNSLQPYLVCFPNTLCSLWLLGIFCSLYSEHVSIPRLTLTHSFSVSLYLTFFWKSSRTLKPELGPFLSAVTAPTQSTPTQSTPQALSVDMFTSH